MNAFLGFRSPFLASETPDASPQKLSNEKGDRGVVGERDFTYDITPQGMIYRPAASLENP